MVLWFLKSSNWTTLPSTSLLTGWQSIACARFTEDQSVVTTPKRISVDFYRMGIVVCFVTHIKICRWSTKFQYVKLWKIISISNEKKYEIQRSYNRSDEIIKNDRFKNNMTSTYNQSSLFERKKMFVLRGQIPFKDLKRFF